LILLKEEEEPALVMQFAVQQHRVLSPSLFTLRPHPARASSVIKPVFPTSQFLAPGLESLQLLPSLRHDRKPFPVGSARAEAGAYQKDAFVEATEATKIAQVAKRLERTAGYFKRLGSLGFWGQLVCSVVAAVILAFSVVISGQATSPVSTYLTTGGIAAAFLSVFWSFGYIRLAQKLRETVGNPSKAPPRNQVVKNLKNGIIINLLGMGATLLGLQATVGALVAKALTTSSAPYLQGRATATSPVLALDVFLVQASGNAIVAHFLGLVFSLELLRSVTQPPAEQQLKSA
jgi:hypothetical protein